MSSYGLIKATSRAMRSDTITDLFRINQYVIELGLTPFSPYGKSVRALENSVALAINFLDRDEKLPKLERGIDFYKSIIPEIKLLDQRKFNLINHISVANIDTCQCDDPRHDRDVTICLKCLKPL